MLPDVAATSEMLDGLNTFTGKEAKYFPEATADNNYIITSTTETLDGAKRPVLLKAMKT